MGERLQGLTVWVGERLAERGELGLSSGLMPVSGDASFRRYFRARADGRSWIAVDAPPEKEDSLPFVEVAAAWRAQGIPVPEVLAADLAQGFMLLEDFGDRLLLAELDKDSADPLYDLALDTLAALQQLSPAGLPPYNQLLLQREMALLDEWFLPGLLDIELSPPETQLLDRVKAMLVDNARSQLQVPVHRDYHSRNLMLREAPSRLGVIDFQDAVEGPVTYDPVSLLKDSYVRWPDADVSRWVEAHRQRLIAAGLSLPAPDVFRRHFDLMGMQRQLKVLGIFARLSLRDGKPGYLKDIPRTFGYLYRACGSYPEFADLKNWLTERVLPAMRDHEAWDRACIDREISTL
jgi:aminoglycoside/choline kinase family phosphotransferase